MISPEYQSRLAEARTHLTEAEKELDIAMQALESGDRANKTMISTVLRNAFEKVAASRRALSSVLDDTASA